MIWASPNRRFPKPSSSSNCAGARLLDRTTRHVLPTAEGDDYYRRCLLILEQIEDADAIAKGSAPAIPCWRESIA